MARKELAGRCNGEREVGFAVMVRILLVTMGLLAAVALWAEVVMPEEVYPELAELMEAALEGGPGTALATAQVGIEVAQGEAETARAGRWPTLWVRGGVSLEHEERIDSNVTNNDATQLVPSAEVRADYTIYDWGATGAAVRVGEVRREQAQLRLEQAEVAVLEQMRRAYLGWLVAKAEGSSADEERVQGERLVREREQLFEMGEVAETELLEARIFLAEQGERALAAAGSVEVWEEELMGLCGARPQGSGELGEEIAVLDEAEMRVWEVRLADTRVSPHAAELALLQKEQELFLERRDEVRARTRPRLDAFARSFIDKVEESFVLTDEAGVRRTEVESVARARFFVGLSVSWNLLDGGLSDGRVRTEQARARLAGARLAEAERRLGTEAMQRWNLVKLNRQRLETARARAELGERRVGLLEQQVREGTQPLRDLVEERTRAARAQTDVQRARSGYLENLAVLVVLYEADPFLLQRGRAPSGD